MSVIVRPAERGDIDSVVDLLFDNMSQKVPKERWRRLLDYPWRPADADRGRVAVDGDRIVGFLGLVYVDRPIGGRIERFCNICAWYLLKIASRAGHRPGNPVQRRRRSAHDLHDHDGDRWRPGAPSRRTAAFRCSTIRAIMLRRSAGDAATVELIDDPDRIAPLLAPEDRTILEHHRPYNRQPSPRAVRRRGVLHRDAGEAEGRGHRLSRGHVCERSAAPREIAPVDRQHAPPVRHRGPCDRPAVSARPRRIGKARRIRLPRWYRSARVEPAKIDHLYGEIALLDLKLP